MSILARTIRIFRRQKRDIDCFLQSNNSVSRTNYYRIFALASIDVALTLPISIANIALDLAQAVNQIGHLPFYRGWTAVHTNWEPVSISHEEFLEAGKYYVAGTYFAYWTSPILAFVIFGLFGVTKEARASYWRVIRTIFGWLGWTPTLRSGAAHSTLHAMEFSERPQNTSVDPDAG